MGGDAGGPAEPARQVRTERAARPAQLPPLLLLPPCCLLNPVVACDSHCLQCADPSPTHLPTHAPRPSCTAGWRRCSAAAAGITVTSERMAAGIKFSFPTYRAGLGVLVPVSRDPGWDARGVCACLSGRGWVVGVGGWGARGRRPLPRGCCCMCCWHGVGSQGGVACPPFSQLPSCDLHRRPSASGTWHLRTPYTPPPTPPPPSQCRRPPSSRRGGASSSP